MQKLHTSWEPAVFSRKQGGGYIVHDEKYLLHHVEPQSFKLPTKILHPGDKTTVDGFLDREVLFIGRFGKEDNHGLFYLGEDEGKHYLKSIFFIEKGRIYIQYAPSSGRDFHFINGRWK